jgi:hypothetical protein
VERISNGITTAEDTGRIGTHCVERRRAVIPMAPVLPLIQGDDGLPAEEVGAWTIEKLNYLARYLDISRGARFKPAETAVCSYVPVLYHVLTAEDSA